MKTPKHIPITKPSFDERDKEAVLKVLDSGWVSQGPVTENFEQEFAQSIGAQHAVATNSCSTALHLALLTLGVGPGDAVVVPAFTWVACANVVHQVRAQVIFCDVDLDSFNIDTNQLEDLLKKDTQHKIKAIMPVHLFGLCADMPTIKELAQKHGAKIIEDAACGFGSQIRGEHCGSFGDVGCFSFHPRKTLTTGEGGMLVTPHKNIAKRARELRNHGASQSDFARHQSSGSLLPEFLHQGFNYRLTDLQAALGLSQLSKASTLLQKRQHLAKKYHQELQHHPRLKRPSTPKDFTHSFQSYVTLYTEGKDPKKISKEEVLTLNQKRNTLMKTLEDQGIHTRQGTHAVCFLDCYKDKHTPKDFWNAFVAERLSLSLPLYADLQESDIVRIIDVL